MDHEQSNGVAPSGPAGHGGRRLTVPFLVLAWIAGLLAAIMMSATTLDVAGRYFLNAPLYGAFEITEITMGLIVFTALPLAVMRREMITVTVQTDL